MATLMAATQNLSSPTFRYPILSSSKPLISVRKPLRAFLRSSSPQNQTLTLNISTDEQKHSFTITYLTKSCGLSPESAISASQKLHLQSPTKPDLVLALFRDHGFSKTQITRLIKKRPVLLLSNPETTLLPKLRFFHSIGISNTDLAKILTSDPTLLTRSLENQIIPSYTFLHSVLVSNDKIVAALKRTTWIFLEDHLKNLAPNVDFLRGFGVPQKCIALLLTHFPEAMIQNHDEFCKIVKEVEETGFDPKKSTFVLAIHAMSGKCNKSTWDKCFEVYRKWGWSKDEIFSAFRKHPNCMMLSEDKITKTMEFFVKQMGWSSRKIAQCPAVLFFSLKKRIIPRCSVIRVLSSKGLVKEDLSLNSVLLPSEKRFLDRFVRRHEEDLPDLMSLYQSEVCPLNFVETGDNS